jgi:type II secretory pathway component PulK
MHRLALGKRGVALIIVLLVTALLIALVFEFAYGTRVSLRAAANFRDSRRAYYLARSGLAFFAKYPQVRDYIPQGPPQPDITQGPPCPALPYISEGDKYLGLCWEDEAGKIDISRVIASQNDVLFQRQTNLFSVRKVDQQILNNIAQWMTENRVSRFYLLSELHRFMRDEEFSRVGDALSVSQLMKVNVNTASADVLKTVFPTADAAERIIDRRKKEQFTESALTSFLNDNRLSNLASDLTATSSVFKVDLYATVGGFTRHIETIVDVGPGGGGSGFTVKYWREL